MSEPNTTLQPGAHAAIDPHRPAVVMAASGEIITYGQLEERSLRVARMLHDAGLRAGDHIAVMLENHPRYFEIFWGAMRSGIYLTPINWHLKVDEAGYIVRDCGATAFFTSSAVSEVAA